MYLPVCVPVGATGVDPLWANGVPWEPSQFKRYVFF